MAGGRRRRAHGQAEQPPVQARRNAQVLRPCAGTSLNVDEAGAPGSPPRRPSKPAPPLATSRQRHRAGGVPRPGDGQRWPRRRPGTAQARRQQTSGSSRSASMPGYAGGGRGGWRHARQHVPPQSQPARWPREGPAGRTGRGSGSAAPGARTWDREPRSRPHSRGGVCTCMTERPWQGSKDQQRGRFVTSPGRVTRYHDSDGGTDLRHGPTRPEAQKRSGAGTGQSGVSQSNGGTEHRMENGRQQAQRTRDRQAGRARKSKRRAGRRRGDAHRD